MWLLFKDITFADMPSIIYWVANWSIMIIKDQFAREVKDFDEKISHATAHEHPQKLNAASDVVSRSFCHNV